MERERTRGVDNEEVVVGVVVAGAVDGVDRGVNERYDGGISAFVS